MGNSVLDAAASNTDFFFFLEIFMCFFNLAE
jgi:hypothetical protein